MGLAKTTGRSIMISSRRLHCTWENCRGTHVLRSIRNMWFDYKLSKQIIRLSEDHPWRYGPLGFGRWSPHCWSRNLDFTIGIATREASFLAVILREGSEYCGLGTDSPSALLFVPFAAPQSAPFLSHLLSTGCTSKIPACPRCLATCESDTVVNLWSQPIMKSIRFLPSILKLAWH